MVQLVTIEMARPITSALIFDGQNAVAQMAQPSQSAAGAVDTQALEAESNGIALGEMQTMLLAKIEELTLHLIEMDKRVNTLDNENKQLKDLLTKLESLNEH